MKYNWQDKNWPQFEYNADAMDDIVLEFALETGEVKGIIWLSWRIPAGNGLTIHVG